MEIRRSELAHKSMRRALIKTAVLGSLAFLSKEKIAPAVQAQSVSLASPIVDSSGIGRPEAPFELSQDRFPLGLADLEVSNETGEVHSGAQAVIINLCKFKGLPDPERSSDYFSKLLKAIDIYFRKNTRGVVSIDFLKSQILDKWFELPGSAQQYLNSPNNPNIDQIAKDCIEATNPVVDYKGINIVANIVEGEYKFGAEATRSIKEGQQIEEKEVVSLSNNLAEVAGFAHELAHALGVLHARVLVGYNADGTAQYDIYANNWTPVGKTWQSGERDPVLGRLPVQMAAPERLLLGTPLKMVSVLDGEEVSGSLTFLDLEESEGPQVVLIDNGDIKYFVESRRRTNDDPVPGNGVLVCKQDLKNYPDGSLEIILPEMGVPTAAWQPGMIFTEGKIKIEILGLSENGLGYDFKSSNNFSSTSSATATPSPKEEEKRVYLPGVLNRKWHEK